MPSIKVVPAGDHSRLGYEQIQAAFGPGAPGALQVVAPTAAAHAARVLGGERPGHRPCPPPERGAGGLTLIQAIPASGPSSSEAGRDDRSSARRASSRALIGGPAAENHDLEAALAAKTPLAIGVVLASASCSCCSHSRRP